MALATGTRFGPYEVTGQIGAGGMGEVYRATDSKLGRDVAVKTLPAALASDKDRLARFEREAKLLAALNHTHIASVFSLDEHDGTLYLAMELVEGETLEEKLKAGALPVEDALRLALQIAQALEAAHDKGVVHRDLKPANIMVDEFGEVKVLDFGLAKAFSHEPEEASPGRSPALSLAMTQQGIILGTAGYMSPEQASGQATDQRADIWAFGVVLYEMLTGLPLFSGESVPHILADVLRMEPDWKRLPNNLHPRIRQALERCLEKKPRNRYAGIADARVDIEQALADPAGLTPEPIALAASDATAPSTGFGKPLAALAVGAAIAGLAVWLMTRPTVPGPLPINRFDWDLPQEFTLRRAGRPTLALSPDGRQFVVNTDQGLLLRRMGEVDGVLIPGTEEDLSSPIFSPDGQSLAYYTFGGDELKRIAISGGAPVGITAGVENPIGSSWAADGTILFAQPEGIFRVPAAGGMPELVFAVEDGERFHGPVLLPDGDSVLFSVAQGGNWDAADIVVGSLATGERSVLVVGGADARYVPTGHLVYAYEDNLFGVNFDLETLTVSGGPVALVQGIARAANPTTNTPAGNFAVADNGTLVYLTDAPFGDDVGARALVWVGPDGDVEPTTMPRCDCVSNNMALSPDGTRVALAITDPDRGEDDLYIWSFAAETLTRLTFESGNQYRPVWTADSQRIVYASAGEGIMMRAANGTGPVEMILAESADSLAPWSRDADGNILFGLNNDIHVVDIENGGESRPLLAEEFVEGNPAISPDGRWIAYVSVETGTSEIYVRPYPDVDSGKWQISRGQALRPVWSADGLRLYFTSGFGTGDLLQAAVQTEPTFTPRTPEELFSYTPYRGYDVAADADRFLMLTIGGRANANDDQQERVIIVENWIEELKQRIPAE